MVGKPALSGLFILLSLVPLLLFSGCPLQSGPSREELQDNINQQEVTIEELEETVRELRREMASLQSLQEENQAYQAFFQRTDHHRNEISYMDNVPAEGLPDDKYLFAVNLLTNERYESEIAAESISYGTFSVSVPMGVYQCYLGFKDLGNNKGTEMGPVILVLGDLDGEIWDFETY